MAELARIDLVHKAITDGLLGNIQWKDSAARLVCANVNLNGVTPGGIRQLLREFVLKGHSLEARQEKRDEYRHDYPFWYRARIPVDGIAQELFVEVVLIDEEIPFVEIVSAHL